jgi:nucleoside-diphosphate-sugar epimerase
VIDANLILVTGAPGWLGTALVGSLVNGLPALGAVIPRGARIRCLVQPGRNAEDIKRLSADVHVIEGDITDPVAVGRFAAGAGGAVLFHAAGIIHPRRAAEFRRVNVDGTRYLFEAAIGAGVRRAVVVSSNSPLGCNPHPDHFFDEHSPYHPYLGYGRSKMQMERYVTEQYARGNIETVIIRPPWFYGPGQPARQTLFFKMICQGKFPVVGSGENRRSMAYIENICQGALLAAAQPSAAGQIYWIADERPYTMNEIVATVASLMKQEFGFACRGSPPRVPEIISKIAYTADYLIQSVGFYHQKIHVLSEMNKTIACTVEKAKRELGYRPLVDLREGMRRSIQWCLDNGLLQRMAD